MAKGGTRLAVIETRSARSASTAATCASRASPCRDSSAAASAAPCDPDGDLAFHATALAAKPALTAGMAGVADEAVLTVNVIVFGVEEQALPAIVTSSWTRAAGAAATTWRR